MHVQEKSDSTQAQNEKPDRQVETYRPLNFSFSDLSFIGQMSDFLLKAVDITAAPAARSPYGWIHPATTLIHTLRRRVCICISTPSRAGHVQNNVAFHVQAIVRCN
ncbi:unnamed protein product, partial [Ectocarpus sp. 12 AP-2014]